MAPLLDHIRFHREVLGKTEAIELRRRALVARFDTLPELALVVAAGEGRRVFLRLVLEDRLDLESELFLRERHEPRRLVNRPFLPGAPIKPRLRPKAGNAALASIRRVDAVRRR